MNTADNLFERLLPEGFDRLPATVRRLHRASGRRSYHGDVVVRRGRGLLSRLCGWATRLPPAGSGPIRVDIESTPDREAWTRHVAGHAMSSRLWGGGGLLRERLGLVTFGFRLRASADGLDWAVERVHVFGLPLPARLFDGVHARESERGGRYAFHVVAALPGAGALVEYHGVLDVD